MQQISYRDVSSGVAADGELAVVVGMLRHLQATVDELRDKIEGSHKDFYTIGEVASHVGRSAYTVRAWIRQGRMRAERVHGTGPRGRLLVPHDELRKLV